MADKFDQMAESFPEEYRERIAEKLRLRADTNERIAATGGEIRVTLEQELEKLAYYSEVPTGTYAQRGRSRSLDQDVATGRRVNAKARKRFEAKG